MQQPINKDKALEEWKIEDEDCDWNRIELNKSEGTYETNHRPKEIEVSTWPCPWDSNWWDYD